MSEQKSKGEENIIKTNILVLNKLGVNNFEEVLSIFKDLISKRNEKLSVLKKI